MDLVRKLEVRPDSSYSQKVIKEIQMVSYNKDKYAQPFGSYIYRIQKYPGDIDLLEKVYTCNGHPCKSKAELIKVFKKRFQQIVAIISRSKGHYYSEVKCGLDERYIFKIGDMNKGIFIINHDLGGKVKQLYDDGLIPKSEYEVIMGIILKGHNDGDDYDIISTIIREHYILRWTPKEIYQGFKILPGNKKMTLSKALEYDTLCKIDMITLINGRFVEITNVYGLGYYDKAGNLYLLNYTADPTTLPLEVEKLYYSNKFYSPFKMLKRIFAYARHEYLYGKEEYADVLNKIIPFISSNTSLLYQLRSEMETIILLFDKFKNPSPASIKSQLDDIKNRLASVVEIDREHLIELQNQIDEVNKLKANSKKTEILEGITKILKAYINKFTIEFLNRSGLNPPPHELLPNPKITDYIKTAEIIVNPLLDSYHTETYDWSIVRTPIDDKLVTNFKNNIKKSVERFKLIQKSTKEREQRQREYEQYADAKLEDEYDLGEKEDDLDLAEERKYLDKLKKNRMKADKQEQNLFRVDMEENAPDIDEDLIDYPEPLNIIPSYELNVPSNQQEAYEQVNPYLGYGFDFGYLPKKAFQSIANIYRNKNCNNKARPLLNGEIQYGCHNFTGPGTRIDLPEVLNYPPYNDIDACSKQHDIDYSNASKFSGKEQQKKIREADEKVIKCYDKYPNENGYNVSKLGINGKMSFENALPLASKALLGSYTGSSIFSLDPIKHRVDQIAHERYLDRFVPRNILTPPQFRP